MSDNDPPLRALPLQLSTSAFPCNPLHHSPPPVFHHFRFLVSVSRKAYQLVSFNQVVHHTEFSSPLALMMTWPRGTFGTQYFLDFWCTDFAPKPPSPASTPPLYQVFFATSPLFHDFLYSHMAPSFHQSAPVQSVRLLCLLVSSGLEAAANPVKDFFPLSTFSPLGGNVVLFLSVYFILGSFPCLWAIH